METETRELSSVSRGKIKPQETVLSIDYITRFVMIDIIYINSDII